MKLRPLPIAVLALPALGANVAWNLATNTVLALALAAAVAMRWASSSKGAPP